MQIIDTRVGDYGGQEPLSDDEIGVRVGDIKVLADKASFYKGRQVEVLRVNPNGIAWVKLANYSPGSIEFSAKMEDLQ
jgi:hypothetical protein